MKRALVVTTIALAILVSPGRMTSQRSQGTGRAARSAPQLVSVDSLKWVTVREGHEHSVLWEDAQTGAHGRLNRFAPGFEDQQHWHTRDLRLVAIAGTLIVQMNWDAPVELGPGSYVLIPGGSPHTHSCKA